ncbi:MAG: hypothetical protein QNJ72_38225 [Pleurocapsa sp. MO_226.B13]|nr:hypothetical protein [Pleurocapsa sp. MO_226.B13]
MGFFETTSQKHLAKELKVAIAQGRLIAISGVVGKLLFILLFWNLCLTDTPGYLFPWKRIAHFESLR